PRRALAGAAVELGEHRLVGHGRRLHVADARAHGVLLGACGADWPRTMPRRKKPFNGRQLGRNFEWQNCRENRLWGISPLRYAHPGPVGGVPGCFPQEPMIAREASEDRMDDVRERFQNLHEFLKAAKFNLNRNNWDYVVGGTETETTLARNR